MARVPYLTKDDLAPEHQDLLARDINSTRALIHSPNALRAFRGLGSFIRYGSKLDPRLRELAILQVGWLARSPYEWSHHVKIGYDFGVSDDDIRALIDETEGRTEQLEPLAKTVLKAAREMTKELAISAATFAKLGERPRQRMPGRSRHHYRFLQRRRARAWKPRNRCRAGLPALSRRVPPSRQALRRTPA